MAFTPTEVTTIRRYFGLADAAREDWWQITGTLASISTETEAAIRTLLTQIATIETHISSSWQRAGLKRAEEVEFFQGSVGSSDLMAEADRLVFQISCLLNFPVKHSVFGKPTAGIIGRG